MRFEQYLTEGGKSGSVRYNTELSCLLAYTGKNKNLSGFDPTDPLFNPADWWDESKLHQSHIVYKEIMTFLPKNYNERMFKTYYDISLKNKSRVTRKTGHIDSLFWVGGSNDKGEDSTPADVEFFGNKSSGISVKGKSGITLSNLSPSRIGLDVAGDAIKYYCDTVDQTIYSDWKKTVILSTLKKARDMKGQVYSPDKKSPYYNITHIGADNYTINSKKTTIDVTEGNLLSTMSRNLEYHSVFGAHLTQNVREFEKVTKKVFETAAKAISPIIQNTFVDHTKVEKILNFSDKSYFYQSLNYIYYVPSRSEFLKTPLEIKKVSFDMGSKASGILLKIYIGLKGSSKYSTIDLWLRYANRVFGSNATVRVQQLKNPESIAWEVLT